MQRKLCTRKIDELGRIVLPQEARTALEITERETLDVYIENDVVILKRNKNIPACALCGETEKRLTDVGQAYVCADCITRIKEIQATVSFFGQAIKGHGYKTLTLAGLASVFV